MRKKVTYTKNKLTSILKHVKINGILPFTEEPSAERGPATKSDEKDARIGATDLFSLFTANIIKEEVVFTR